MHSHLVTIKVCIKRGTHQGMKLDSLTLYKDGLECLDTESVKCRCTVKHNGVLLDHILEHIPHAGLQTLYHLLCCTDVVCGAVCHQFLHNEGLEQLDSHFLGETALIDLKLGTNHDNGTARIVNSLTQKVLTETSALTLKHIGKRLEVTVSGACNGTASSAVIDEGVNRLLKHSLFVADDYLGSSQIKESPESVVSVYDTTVQIVKVGGSKTSAVQLYHGTKIRRDHRDHVEDHPLGLVSGLDESLDSLQTLYNTGLLLAGGIVKFCL